MEPANLHPQHHHQLQEEFSEYYSSLLSQPEYKVSGTGEFNPGIILNIDNTTCSKYATDSSPNSIVPWPPTRDSRTMSQGLSFSDATSYTFAEQSANLLLSKIKEEMPDSFPKLSEMIYGSSNGEDPFFLSTKLKQQYTSVDNLGENSWQSNFSSGQSTAEFQLSGPKFCSLPQNSPSLEHQSGSGRHNYYSHIPPRVNTSTSDLCFSLVSSSLDLNLRACDLLFPRYDGAGGSQYSQNNPTHFMQDLKDSHSSSSNKTSVSTEDGVGRRKRSLSSLSQSKNTVPEAKKHRSPPQSSSFPLLKVRKEKLGDRIAALQRLAAPYGKTDTASVLTEAIRYIQFLHEQVQTLSVPYMRLSHRKPNITNQAISSSEEEGKGQPKRELRSRGLCLVPLSYASFFAGYNGSN